jgi:hypothetical protein
VRDTVRVRAARWVARHARSPGQPSKTIPKLDGVPIELNPPKLYASPYIDADWDAPTVTLKFPGMQDQVLQF